MICVNLKPAAAATPRLAAELSGPNPNERRLTGNNAKPHSTCYNSAAPQNSHRKHSWHGAKSKTQQRDFIPNNASLISLSQTKRDLQNKSYLYHCFATYLNFLGCGNAKSTVDRPTKVSLNVTRREGWDREGVEGANTLQLGESDVTLNKGTQYGDHSIVKRDFIHSEGSQPLTLHSTIQHLSLLKSHYRAFLRTLKRPQL